ncbi:hypothetical protein SAMN05216436_11451 [bacterium A37T11]|nr:hypothetical protein SAMN05216436_11451 [bacterium A37T11]
MNLQSSFLSVLNDIEPVLVQFGIEYFLVGAVARDLQLGMGAESPRRTLDVDMAVLIDEEAKYYALKDALIATSKFRAHPKEAIKL